MVVGETLHIFVSAEDKSLQSPQRKKAGDKVSNVLQKGVLNESDFTTVDSQLQVLEFIERRVERSVQKRATLQKHVQQCADVANGIYTAGHESRVANEPSSG